MVATTLSGYPGEYELVDAAPGQYQVRVVRPVGDAENWYVFSPRTRARTTGSTATSIPVG